MHSWLQVGDPISLYNAKSRWVEEIVRHSSAPLLLCGCMADLRTDEGTVAHLARLGRSPVTPEQAVAVASQIGARNYVETAALVSYTETFSLFSLAAVTGLEHRRSQRPAPAWARPGSVASHSSNVSRHQPPGTKLSSSHCGSHNSLQAASETGSNIESLPRDQGARPGSGSVPVSPVKPQPQPGPVHTRSASQPVRTCLELSPRPPPDLRPFSPHSPPPPRPSRTQVTSPSSSSCQSPLADSDNAELRSKTGAHLSRKSSFRSSLPVATGKPPLPSSALPKSPTELLQLSGSRSGAITTEPGVAVSVNKSRLTQLGIPEGSLKSHTSTISHGSTGSKMSSTSSHSHLSAIGPSWSGPRDLDIPDTEDPELLRNLEFVSPKAGVYRPVGARAAAGAKKDKCSLM